MSAPVVRVSVEDDLTTSFGRMRSRLADPSGGTYRTAREPLQPRWWVVAVDLGATLLLLAAVAVVTASITERVPWPAAVVCAALAAAAIGVLVHRVGLFIHEGAHFNVAPGRANDIVTNVFAGAMTMTDVRDYRVSHMAHHRLVGTPDDPERRYFQRLDSRFLLRAALGAQTLEAVKQRAQRTEGDSARKGVYLVGAALHGVIVVGAFLLGYPWLAAAWAVGVAAIYPVVHAFRQLAEHRRTDADGDVDYASVPHGAFTRMFSGDRFAWVLGGVGFNRHLLHHWDAGVSYTRLRELERWLGTTDAAPIIAARRSTYVRTARELWKR